MYFVQSALSMVICMDFPLIPVGYWKVSPCRICFAQYTRYSVPCHFDCAQWPHFDCAQWPHFGCAWWTHFDCAWWTGRLLSEVEAQLSIINYQLSIINYPASCEQICLLSPFYLMKHETRHILNKKKFRNFWRNLRLTLEISLNVLDN